jgi:predicted transcriptional regulator
MARAALQLGVRDLAERAAVSPNTIARLERGEDLRESTLNVIRRALEAAGVEFIAENGGGPGVRLRERG